MPYISAAHREELDSAIAALAERLRTLTAEDVGALSGALNYSITRLLWELYGAKARYHEHNEIMGVLESVKQEWYRRQVSPYEEKKARENGDVFD
jgi:hypothetical protein